MTTGAEVIVAAIFVIPIIAAFSILRRERLEGSDRPKRPLWVSLAIAIVIAIPLWGLTSVLVQNLDGGGVGNDANTFGLVLIAIGVVAFIVRLATHNRPALRALSMISALVIIVLAAALIAYIGSAFFAGSYGGIPD